MKARHLYNYTIIQYTNILDRLMVMSVMTNIEEF